jgi:2-polyprenyl-3-methyl-5-hydroxy-6-metoxy-1,4-benzoquinol methylase
MEKLLPDQLKTLWQSVAQQQLTAEAFYDEQERLLATYRDTWKAALLLAGYEDLAESILSELGAYMRCQDPVEMKQQCLQAVATLKGEWHTQVNPTDRQSVERYYDKSQGVIYELMWWHTLGDDTSPLAYVTALQFAQQHACHRYLDFGAGVGSGGILFARHGFAVTLADISSTMLHFSQWRLDKRQLPATYIDLKTHRLPPQAFDFITAMDVFEHLVDPVETAERLWEALRPGGFLFARLAAEVNEDRPQHIVQDFGPTLERLHALGGVRVWEDEWLWGHQVFRKSLSAL